MTLSEELAWRGFVNQTTFKDVSVLDGAPLTFYWGVDPSADSMTVGNLAAAMMVRHFIDHGHKAILLVGGATAMIGDPDGRSEERDLKSFEEVARNKTAIVDQYHRVFDGQHFEIVDNYGWFKDIKYLDFLRDIGKHLSMTQLLDREFVKARIGGRGISYAEFSYSLIQGYDFLHLNREKGVSLQVCGADQWGNSLAGVEMIRKIDGREAHVWSTPLIINKATGKKFGKSEEGAVWLNEQKTSVYKFYQFWLNADDEGVADYLKVYTLLPKEEIERLERASKENPGAREAQKVLAYEVTKLVHGQDRADSVRRVNDVLFGGHAVSELNQTDLDALAAEIPTVKTGGTIVASLVEAGVATTNSEVLRLLDSGGVTVNGEKAAQDRTISETTLLKKGKNGFVLVR